MTLSDPTSAVTSSEFGWTTTPWTDSSSDSSTKSCRLMKPRIGGGAVTTSSVSPASGSTSLCSRPGLASGTRDIGEYGVGDVADTISGSGGACMRSAKVSVQFGAAGAAIAFQRRHLRAVEAHADGLALFQRQPADIADDARRPWRGSPRHRSARSIEHQPHRVGAAEHGRGRRRGKGKRHAQAVAVAPRLDGAPRLRRFRRLCAAGRLLRRCGFWRFRGSWRFRRGRGGAAFGRGRQRFATAGSAPAPLLASQTRFLSRRRFLRRR